MNNTEIINRLYALFEEAIVSYPEKDIDDKLEAQIDSEFDRNLKYIRKLNAVAKAKIQKSFWSSAKEEFEKLIQQSGRSNFFSSLISQPQYQEVNALFSKYKDMTDEDKESMLSDKKMLELVKKIKEDLQNEPNKD